MERLSVVYRGTIYRRNPTAKQRARRVYYWCHDKWKQPPHSLHRDMWVDAYGPIPSGMHLHHKDGNPFHNELSNFELKRAGQHMADHMCNPRRKRQSRRNMLRYGIPAARAWHASDAGKKWHSERAKKQWKNPKIFRRICEECHKPFNAFHQATRRCSDHCHARFWRRTHPGYYQQRNTTTA